MVVVRLVLDVVSCHLIIIGKSDNFMEQSPSCEAGSSSSGQEIPLFLYYQLIVPAGTQHRSVHEPRKGE